MQSILILEINNLVGQLMNIQNLTLISVNDKLSVIYLYGFTFVLLIIIRDTIMILVYGQIVLSNSVDLIRLLQSGQGLL